MRTLTKSFRTKLWTRDQYSILIAQCYVATACHNMRRYTLGPCYAQPPNRHAFPKLMLQHQSAFTPTYLDTSRRPNIPCISKTSVFVSFFCTSYFLRTKWHGGPRQTLTHTLHDIWEAVLQISSRLLITSTAPPCRAVGPIFI